MIKSFWVAGLVFALTSTLTADEFDLIRERYRDRLVGSPGLSAGETQVAALRSQIVRAAATNGAGRDPVHGTGYWDTLNVAADTPTPRKFLWADLADETLSAQVTESYKRLFGLAQAYVAPGTGLAGRADLRADILSGLEWMHAHRYNPQHKEAANWWDWEIGAPLALLDTLMLFQENVPAAQQAAYLETIRHFSPVPGFCNNLHSHGAPEATGANLVWSCRIAALCNVLMKNAPGVRAARTSLSAVFAISTHGDGFHRDGSFLQHVYFPYAGGYGVALISDLTDYIALFDHTPWALDRSQVATLLEWLRDAYAPFVFRGEAMDLVRGREIARSYTPSHAVGRRIAGVFLRALAFAEGEPAVQLKTAAKSWLLSDITEVRPDGTTNPLNGLQFCEIPAALAVLHDSTIGLPESPRHFSFPAMDRVVHQSSNWAAGLAMYSVQRVKNCETGNGENLHGSHTADGMLYLYTADLRQFSDDFWPTIDPQRMPGTTVERDAFSQPNAFNGSHFVGSLTSGDGRYGIAAMELKPASQTLRAKKSWFFFDREIVCLGGEIDGDGKGAVETIVENRRLAGDGSNRFSVNGVSALTAVAAAPASPGSFANVRFAYLAGNAPGSGIGYYFPAATKLEGLRERRAGRWSEINDRSWTDSSLRHNNFLTLWFNHGVAPRTARYAYAVLPAISENDLSLYAANPDFHVLENSATAQAVKADRLNLTAVTFWSMGPHTVGQGEEAVTADAPAMILIARRGSALETVVADPTQAQAGPIRFELRCGARSVLSCDPGITVLQTTPIIRFEMAPAAEPGSRLKVVFLLR